MPNYLGLLLSPESDRLCNVVNGRYLYMNDLARLDACAPRARRRLPARFRRVATPVDRLQWRALLRTHPDSRFVDYVLRGFEHGFRIGLNSSHHRRTARNFRSAATHASVVRGYFCGELEAGRIVGPVEPKWVEHVSLYSVIPKPHQPCRWRLITDPLRSARKQSERRHRRESMLAFVRANRRCRCNRPRSRRRLPPR